MNDNLTKCYELLGVKPGVSPTELKAAYRDLAKVWHPDRFSHDPRLQTKAQEKLKEINEAYEQLISGKAKRTPEPPPRKSSPPPRQYTYSPSPEPHAPEPRTRWHLVVLVLIIFGAGFVFTTRSLLKQQLSSVRAPDEQIGTVEIDREQESTTRPADEPSEARNRAHKETNTTEETQTSQTVAPVVQVSSLTVTIDPETGMLARPECPLKSRTIYAAGNEPKQYCTTHTAAWAETQRQKDSRIKSAAKRISSPSKWFDEKEKPQASNKP